MVCGDAIHHQRILAVASRHFDAELNVGALVFVSENLANVVEQCAASREIDIETELGGHDAGEPGNFLRVIEDILAVARSPTHAANEFHQLWMQAVHTALVSCLLAGLDDRRVDFLTRFVDDLLDPTGMDAAVGNQFFQRKPRDLTANRIEAGYDDSVGSVVDDDIDARRQLERANVSAFAANDPPLHFIIGQGNGRDSRLDALLGGNALDRQCDDFLCLAFRVALGRFADLADPVGGIGLGFLFHAVH